MEDGVWLLIAIVAGSWLANKLGNMILPPRFGEHITLGGCLVHLFCIAAVTIAVTMR